MDNKIVLAIVLVAVLAIGGAGAYFLLSDNEEDDSYEPNIKGRCVIFGNTNNDDYLNQDDMTLLKQIVSDGVWDYKLYPYADANHDGAVDNKDIDYLDNILNKKNPTKLYYVGMTGNVYDMAYPAVGNIGVNGYYGFYNAMAIGIYDRITAATNVCIDYPQDMFPGCNKLTVIGTSSTFDTELVMKSDIKYTLGYAGDKRYDQLKPVGVDVIQLNATGVSAGGLDVMTTVITLGTMFDQIKEVDHYKSFFDKVLHDIEEKSKLIPREYTYVMPYNPNSYVENSVDTAEHSSNYMLGDVYAMSLIPMRDLVWSANDCCPKIQTEDIIKWDPDFIIFSNVNKQNATADPSEVMKTFTKWADYYKNTNAYKNKNFVGISYDAVGCAFGIGSVPLICSYLWPDIFDEEEGWKILSQSVDDFTMLEFDDIKKCGGLIPYKILG